MLVPVKRWVLSGFLISLLCGCSEESRLRMKAGAGDPVAMRKFGEKLWEKGPTQEDANEGIEWIRKAAGRGDPEAMYMFGSIFDSPPGTNFESLGWYRKGANAGNRLCMIKLASAYRYGLYNLPKDPVEAKKWFDASERARGLAER